MESTTSRSGNALDLIGGREQGSQDSDNVQVRLTGVGELSAQGCMI